ncbi:hypothetical protein EYB53_015505 [Candidatus Chloroploca sp. M-50]|uniref:Response regulatory domain-containing protein n=1 Tax=Candidatus Chloroploca mongolica TaxID=2528176 RepID=A0ABS4DCF1_9CHLR|nr:hypothetical protein [Candidatus Chloroploca mongolica]MBP1467119.1 hypothetical protein [Candidatus Chloroploca mongolica]
MHKAYTAIFVGKPDAADLAMLQDVRVLVDIEVVVDSEHAYRCINDSKPDYVLLPVTLSDTSILRIFHELRTTGRTCVIVITEQTITAFNGRGYRWRRTASKTSDGLDSLLAWGKWPVAVVYKHSLQPIRFSDQSVQAGLSGKVVTLPVAVPQDVAAD